LTASIDTHNDLVRRTIKIVPLVHPQNVGRPLDASEAQCAQVFKLCEAGKSLPASSRRLASASTPSGRSSRSRAAGDRTSKVQRGRIEIEQQATSKRQRRSIGALPRRINQVLEDSRELVKEVKGLK
jgi:hypothetical protein